jgi:hypothetical protein
MVTLRSYPTVQRALGLSGVWGPEVLKFQNVRLLTLAVVADDPCWLGDVQSVRTMSYRDDEQRFEERSVHGAPSLRVLIAHGPMPYGITSSRRRATPAAAASADS